MATGFRGRWRPAIFDHPWAVEADFNASSRDQWEGFADHRRMVTRWLLDGSTPGAGRLCVLGAGNANDLDLAALLANFRDVQLVDFDGPAMIAGAERQGVAGAVGLRILGGLDATGMAQAMGRWSPSRPVGDGDLAALQDWPADRVALGIGAGGFDVVASTCLLSQLAAGVTRALGEGHPRLGEAIRSIRLGHLRLLARLARPGGTAWLITDLVSTDHHPELASMPPGALIGLAVGLARRGGAIRGTNPGEILGEFRRDPVLASALRRPEPVAPWLWKLHRRHYLVWAVRCRLRVL